MGNSVERQPVLVYGIEYNTTDNSKTIKWPFWVIHITAVCSLIISILVSAGVIIYLLWSNPQKNIFKRPIGDRLVLYLAVCDFLFSASHMLDHAYMIAVLDNPPVPICRAFAFFLQIFVTMQSIIVLLTALNAFMMVVKERRLNFGKNDWKLLGTAIGIPSFIGFIGVGVPFLGPSGAWCFVDMAYVWGAAINNVYGIIMVIVFIVNLVSYSCIWFKIKQAAKRTTGSSKYHNTAKMMMLFVLANLIQYWPFVFQALWTLVDHPHVAVYILAVFLCNLGGVYNFVAYTLIRKRYSKVDTDKSEASKTISTVVH